MRGRTLRPAAWVAALVLAAAGAGAEEDLTKDCDAGDLESCQGLAYELATATGADRDTARAARLYRKACEGGLGISCYNLALLAKDGDGMPKDEAEAVRLLSRAVDLGYVEAHGVLASMYVTGTGVPRDISEGMRILQAGCKAGDTDACFQLREMESIGLVRKDLDRFGDAGPPKGVTLAESALPDAVTLRQLFPDGILMPAFYKPSEIPITPKEIAKLDATAEPQADGMLIVSGTVTLGPLPAGFRVPDGDAYRRRIVAHVVSPEGKAWSKDDVGDVSVSAKTGAYVPIAQFRERFFVLGEHAGKLAGSTLVVVVAGEAISVGPGDAGGMVILGVYVKKL